MPSHNCINNHNVQFSRYILSFKKLNEVSLLRNFSQFLYSGSRSGGPRTRFSAEKPRRLQQSPGLLPRAAFRVHFGLTYQRLSIVQVLTSFEVLQKWWAKMDSNHRPHDYQSCALASWAIGPFWLLHFSGTLSYVPSKLNNASSYWTLCTDLRTLQEENLFSLKSP